MKCFLYLFLFLFSSQFFGQKNQLTFDKEYIYRLNIEDTDSDFNNLIIKLYAESSKNIGLVDIYTSNLKTDLTIFKEGKLLKLENFNFEDQKITRKNAPHLFNRMKEIDSLMNSKITLEPLNKKGNFLGFSCEYYLIRTDLANVNNSEKYPCACIDTTNINKNLKLIFPNSNIDGLILGYSFSQNLEEMLALNEFKNISINTSFDFDQEYINAENEFNEFIKRIEIEEDDHVFEFDESILPPSDSYYKNYSQDPLCISYIYLSELDLKLQNLASQFTNIGCQLFCDKLDFNQM